MFIFLQGLTSYATPRSISSTIMQSYYTFVPSSKQPPIANPKKQQKKELKLFSKFDNDSKQDKPFTQQQKYVIVKSLAKQYVKEGSGFKKAKEVIQKQLHCKITAAAYNNFITTIVRMAFRQLEQFLSKHTGKEVKPITYAQQRVIRSPMIQCREWMSQQNAETLLKFISAHYQLETVSISVQEALSLYRELFGLIENSHLKDSILEEKRRTKSNARIENEFNKVENKIKRSKHFKHCPREIKREQSSSGQKRQEQQMRAVKRLQTDINRENEEKAQKE